MSDIGREFFIPSEIAAGKTLYSDIFNLYAPLGYLINAVFVKLFTDNIIVYCVTGLILTLCSLFAVYKIAKMFANETVSVLTSLFVLVACAFYPSLSNWITPYSYSVLYSLCFILWALYFLLRYVDDKMNKHLYLSCFLYGVSMCSKYEYMLFILPVIIVLVKFKADIGTIIKSILSAIFPFLLTLVLLLTKTSVSNLFLTLKYSFSLLKSDYVSHFYNYSGITISLSGFKHSVFSLLHPHFVSLFLPLGYILIFVLIWALLKKYDFKFLLLNISAILICVKSLGGINLEIYGTYFLPVLFLTLIAFLSSKINVKVLSFLIFSLFVSYFSFDVFQNKNFVPLETNKGIVKLNSDFFEKTQKLVNYIEENTEKDDTVLLLPEGVFINYLTNRKTDDYLFYLIPPHLEILSEDFVINRIKNGNYKYIIISNQMYDWFKQPSFLRGWGKNVTEYIKSEYTLKEVIGNNFKYYVYVIN